MLVLAGQTQRREREGERRGRERERHRGGEKEADRPCDAETLRPDWLRGPLVSEWKKESEEGKDRV